MSKALGWRSSSRYCEAINQDGTRCGNLVRTLPSGAIIYRKCAVHRRLDERKAREKREQT